MALLSIHHILQGQSQCQCENERKVKSMPNLFKFMIVAAVVFLTSACATSIPPNHIDRAARSHFDAVDTYLVVRQPEIVAGQIKTHISGGYELGFLEMMALASVEDTINRQSQAHAESLVAPIRDSLHGYDFAEALAKEMNAKIGEIEWLNSKDLVLTRQSEKDFLLKKCESSHSSAILFIGAQYWISPDLSHVNTQVKSIMFPNIAALEVYKAKMDGNQNPVDQTDNIYRSQFRVHVPLKVEGLVKDRVGKLTRNKGEKVRSALAQCAVKAAEYFALDIERDETADKKK